MRRHPTRIPVLFPLWLGVWLLAPPVIADPWPKQARDAQNLYRAGQHAESVEAYRAVIEAGDPRPELAYNLGNAAYRAAAGDSTRFEEAYEAYQRAVAAGDAALRPDALYNAANALVETGDLKGAEALYRETLRQNPTDDQARYNLELVQRLLENQPPPSESKEQQQSSGENDSQQDEERENEPSEAPPDSAQGPEQTPQQEDQPQQESSGDQQDQQEQEEPQEPADAPEVPPEISPDEARRELEKLEEAEREILREMLMARRKKLDVEKDW